MNIKINFLNLLFWIFVLFVSISSLNSKAAGMAWLALLLCGLGAMFGKRLSHTGSKGTNETLAKIWLIATVLAFLLKIVPTIYWNDSWGERHAEIRLLLGALGTYALCRWDVIREEKVYLMAWAVSFSCGLAMLLMLVSVREAAPTNPIPWAAAIALCSAWLVSIGFSHQVSSTSRWVWGIGSLMGLIAVLISENRGAYGLALLLPVVWMRRLSFFRWIRLRDGRSAYLRLSVVVLVILIGGALFSQTAIVQRPLQRIQVAIDEVKLSHESLEANVNGSIGARLFLWAHSASFIEQSPWIGHGQVARKNAIVEWGKEANSDQIQSLGHVHNEYLHTLMDYGVWGLASLMCYAMGMFILVLRMRSIESVTQAWAMGGVLFIHMTTGLTNVNFAHNYYPTMLSIMISLILLTPSIKCNVPRTG